MAFLYIIMWQLFLGEENIFGGLPRIHYNIITKNSNQITYIISVILKGIIDRRGDNHERALHIQRIFRGPCIWF